MKDLDFLAAKAAQAIVRDVGQEDADETENLVTKALGVIQENGIYAGMLYLFSRKNQHETGPARNVRQALLGLLTADGLEVVEEISPDDVKPTLSTLADEVCNDLDTLLLVKQLWEQTLIYARYSARSIG